MPHGTTASGKWTVAGVPHKGWSCIDIEELDEQDHICEMCEVREIRFVHIMEHPAYPQQLRVGCICAGHMEQNLSQAKQREANFKNSRSRRNRWLTRKWRTSASGNEFLNTREGFNVVVYSKGRIWGGKIEHRVSGFSRTSKLPYLTQDQAKLAAFDAMIGMMHSRPWNRVRKN